MKYFLIIFLVIKILLAERYIVQFREEKSTKERINFLNVRFPKTNYKYEIVGRKEILSSSDLVSDFSVVETESTLLIQSLRVNSNIKRVSKDKKYQLNDIAEEEVKDMIHEGPQTSKIGLTSSRSQNAPVTRKKDVPSLMEAKKFWDKGFTCKDIKIAIFDTGLRKDHPFFNHVEEIINFTDEDSSDDLNGHGTMVAGIIAGRNDIAPKSKSPLYGSSKQARCRGLCPDSTIYIFKVFNKKNEALTSWFLDAFNYALKLGVHIINLSNGGRDTHDHPFMEKVNELAANNVIIISAIGNKGPFYGSLFNPGDMASVIGVGGITYDDKISQFSSRGSSTKELQHGYGIVKPDLVTYSNNVVAIDAQGYCSSRSGTSLSSPIVAGSIGLLASTLPPDVRWKVINPASIRQIFFESSQLLPDTSIFEQGGGKLRLLHAYHSLVDFQVPKTTVFPSKLDITDCPSMSPFCYQPIYYKSIPLVVNLTVHNSVTVFSSISKSPIFIGGRNGFLLRIWFEYDEYFWPWSGTLSVHVTANSKSSFFLGNAEGLIEFEVSHQYPFFNKTEIVQVPLRVRIVRPPKKEKHLLWDMYHNIQFPPAYVPNDDLFQSSASSELDGLGDHPHTNFYDLYLFLRTEGYFVGTLTEPYTSLPAISNEFATLVMVDLEEEYTGAEREALLKQVREDGLSLLIIANWYSVEVIEAMVNWDEETKRSWRPITGGANIPALNALLDPVGIAFGDGVWEGKFDFTKKKREKSFLSYFWGSKSSSLPTESSSRKNRKSYYKSKQQSTTTPSDTNTPTSSRMKGIFASGTRIIRFPKNGYLWFEKLQDRTSEVIRGLTSLGGAYAWGSGSYEKRVPILGMTEYGKGRIVVFGDSGCIDSQTVGVLGPNTFGEMLHDQYRYINRRKKQHLVFKEESCFEFFQALLEYTGTGMIPDELKSGSKMEILKEDYVDVYTTKLPSRPPWDDFWEFSKVEVSESARSKEWQEDSSNSTDTRYNWRLLTGGDPRYHQNGTSRKRPSTTLFIVVFLSSGWVFVFFVVIAQGKKTKKRNNYLGLSKRDYYERVDKLDYHD